MGNKIGLGYHARSKKRGNKSRICLMCNEEFDSKGPYNRRCVKCDKKMGRDEYMFTPEVYQNCENGKRVMRKNADSNNDHDDYAKAREEV